MALHESAEMYLETIYMLTQRKTNVRSVDIAEHMSYSKPSVSRAVGLLKQGGYIAVDTDGFITLTPEGLAVAKKIFERHTVITQLLTRIGISEKTAAEDACKIEHVISDETFLAVKKYLDNANNALQ
jgi:Mn-dependent DtxR family transcriptional regulator